MSSDMLIRERGRRSDMWLDPDDETVERYNDAKEDVEQHTGESLSDDDMLDMLLGIFESYVQDENVGLNYQCPVCGVSVRTQEEILPLCNGELRVGDHPVALHDETMMIPAP